MAPPGEVRALLASLRLAEPVPTTDPALFFQRPTFDALQSVLAHGAFFFEELDNGTRLRLVSASLSQAELTSRVAASLESLSSLASQASRAE
jgi:hypothetical protein